MARRILGYIRPPFGKDATACVSVQQDSIARYVQHLGLPTASVYVDDAKMCRFPLNERPAGGALGRAAYSGDHVVFAQYAYSFKTYAEFRHWLDNQLRCRMHIHILDVGYRSSDHEADAVLSRLEGNKDIEHARYKERWDFAYQARPC